MAAQDILSLGIDIKSFDEDKKTILNDYISIFNQLSKYDGKVFNPIVGGGLNDLNTSVKETSLLLDQLNTKISSVGSAKSSSGSKDSFTEQALAVKEYAKQTDAAAVASAKLSVLTSDQAKQTAALKLQLSDTTKEILANARAESEAGKAKSLAKVQAQEYSIEQRRVVDTLRQLAIEQDREAAIQAKASKEKEASMLAEGNAVKNLASDYEVLKLTLAQQRDVYASSLLKNGENHPETKSALSEYATTAGVIDNVNSKLNTSHGILSIVGKDLSTYYNRLRIIAYILPGIGVAGIFSLAFEAIAKASEALGLFDDKSTKLIDLNTKENEQLSSKIQLYENLLKLEKDYHEAFEFELSGTNQSNTVQQQAIAIGQDKSSGTNKDIITEEEVGNAIDRLNQAAFNIGIKPGETSSSDDIVNAVKQESSNDLQILRGEADRVATLKDELNKTLREKKFLGIGVDGDVKLAESKLKQEESTFAYFNNAYNASLGKLKEYYDAKNDLLSKQNAQTKQNEEERRKEILDNATTEISISEAKNKRISGDERSTEQQKIRALKVIEDLQKRQNQANYDDVKNTKPDVTHTELLVASNKRYVGNKSAELDNVIKTTALIESYRQKRLTAQEDIDKSTLNEVVSSNEKIYQNEQKSIYDRLTAYSVYIVNKQKIDDVEYKRNIDVLSLKTGDKTAQLQIEALNKHREEQKLSDQADVEKEVYNVVYGGEHKQLELIKEVNQGRYSETKSAHIKEITDLKDSLDKKEISYRKYYREVEKMQKALTRKDLVGNIDVDEQNLQPLLDKQSKLHKEGKVDESKAEVAGAALDFAKDNNLDTLQYKREYDIAVGNEEAISKAIIDIDTATNQAQKQLQDDKYRLMMFDMERTKKSQEDLAKVITEIGNKVLDGTKDQVDAGYQYQEAIVEKKKELIDQGLESELNAISISTLSSKDKAALDIQLNEQKKENDKNADLEERRLKRSQAEADRAFAVAKIVWNTEQAISKTYAEFGSLPIAFPLAIAQGVLGAVEIATVLATPIPAFKEGVKGFSGGLARTGEDGVEEIREPYKSPYLVYKDTVSYLPAGTDVIPLEDMDIPEQKIDTGWDQTRWLAKQMKKNNREIKNVFRPVINIDLGFESHKRKILGN